jgi:hypothetical protein
MFPIDEQTAVLVASACLAVHSALILIWRVSARSAEGTGPAPVHREERAASKSVPAPPPVQVSPLPAAAPRAAAAPFAEAAKLNSADDPYGVMATLPAGASYTAIAVATAEAAALAKVASAANSRT